MNNIGEKIHSLRKEKKVSQEELAFKLNVARPTISRWENNAVQPTTENFKSLCEFFNVEITYFFDDGETVSANTVAETPVIEAVKKEPKFRTLKIVSIVVGMVLLALCITACGIAAFIYISPDEVGHYIMTSESVSWWGVVSLIVGVIATAIFITLTIIFLRKHFKNKKNNKL